jgi:hypothetical protein
MVLPVKQMVSAADCKHGCATPSGAHFELTTCIEVADMAAGFACNAGVDLPCDYEDSESADNVATQ